MLYFNLLECILNAFIEREFILDRETSGKQWVVNLFYYILTFYLFFGSKTDIQNI